LSLVRKCKELENKTFRELDVFPSSSQGRETPTLLGPVERANLDHWIKYARSSCKCEERLVIVGEGLSWTASVVRVLGYRSGGPGSIPGTTKKVLGLERGPLSLVSTTEELLDRKVAAPV
jgi:hypothetical protein